MMRVLKDASLDSMIGFLASVCTGLSWGVRYRSLTVAAVQGRKRKTVSVRMVDKDLGSVVILGEKLTLSFSLPRYLRCSEIAEEAEPMRSRYLFRKL